MGYRTVVTGLGFITCIGNSLDAVRTSLLELKGGIRPAVFLENPNIPVKGVGKPPDFEMDSPSWRKWSHPSTYQIDPSLKRSVSPQGIYSICALEQALNDALLDRSELRDGETGLYCASVGSPLMLHDNLTAMMKARGERGNPLGILSSIAGTLNFNLGSWLGIRGTNCGYVSACASGNHALGYAFDDICLGRQNRAIVIGAEEASAESLLPFSAMRALSTNPVAEKASRPFDLDRDGFVGAGGATVVILEEERFARRRGANIYARFEGWGQMSDGYHRASPEPGGRGLEEAMQKALISAGIKTDQLDHICAHATSTPAGDLAEALAIKNLIRARLSEITVSAPKGLTGHSLSMAGVLEFAICCLMLKERFRLGNANLDTVDPACSHLNLPRQTESAEMTWILNNSSGFGGSNVCNVLKRYD